MPLPTFEFINQAHPILVFGRDGQVGRALQLCLRNLEVPSVFLGRADCDLTSESSIIKVINRYKPQMIINAAAYTAVDKAEGQPELAFAINARAPELMAQYVANIANGILVHYSSDYVFADTKQDPYSENDSVGPIECLNVYGHSKLAGELAIQKTFAIANGSSRANSLEKSANFFILRTSWVYGDGDNFIRTILRLAKERGQLKVVDDQVGVPTSARWLAEMTMQVAQFGVASGIYHMVPDGETSWYELAVYAVEVSSSFSGVTEVETGNILPIPATEYRMLAKRPYNSRLNNAKLKKLFSEMTLCKQYPHWREQVEGYVKDYVSKSLKSSSNIDKESIRR